MKLRPFILLQSVRILRIILHYIYIVEKRFKAMPLEQSKMEQS